MRTTKETNRVKNRTNKQRDSRPREKPKSPKRRNRSKRNSENHSQCQVVINVSDEFYLGNSEEIMKEGKLNYYFPMGEVGN